MNERREQMPWPLWQETTYISCGGFGSNFPNLLAMVQGIVIEVKIFFLERPVQDQPVHTLPNLILDFVNEQRQMMTREPVTRRVRAPSLN